MKLHDKNLSFKNSVMWTEDKKGVVSAAHRDDIVVATPPEFHGHEGIWSPEDMFVASINTCVMTTFLAFAERAELAVESYESEAEGTLHFSDAKLHFARVVVRPRIVVSGRDSGRLAAEVMQKAEANCLVSNSVRTEVELQPDISTT